MFLVLLQITFLGHSLNKDGISPDPSKVAAIKEMPYPENKADLQRFLGMVAYLSKFIPNLSNQTELLRQLLTKDKVWEFTENHKKQYDDLKVIISSHTLLKFYDQTLPTKLTCDSSKKILVQR